MKEWLKKIWRHPVVNETEHPTLGRLELTRIRGKESWDGEITIGGAKIGAYFNTQNSALPSEKQIAFLYKMATELDATFARAAPQLVPCYESMYGPVPGLWRDIFMLVGVEIPLDADESNPWMLQFEGKTHRLELYTVYFRNGIPENVSCDS